MGLGYVHLRKRNSLLRDDLYILAERISMPKEIQGMTLYTVQEAADILDVSVHYDPQSSARGASQSGEARQALVFHPRCSSCVRKAPGT